MAGNAQNNFFDYLFDDEIMIIQENGRKASSHSRFERTSSRKKTQKDNICSMQLERYEVFKAQDHEKGHFDCVLEIEGKKLYVHKYFLASASPTFNAMISDRWNKNNDNLVKIEHPDYTFDDVYQLMCFIYSCKCEITKANVAVLTDMSEFYGIDLLKESCVEFLLNMDIIIDDVEKIVEIAQRYFLDEFLEILNLYVKSYMGALIDSEQFVNYKKSFIEYMSTLERDYKLEEPLFDAVYKWAHHRATKEASETMEENFNFEACVLNELKEILPNLKFFCVNFKFVKQSILGKRFLFTPDEFYSIVANSVRNYYEEDELFKILYEVAKDVVKEKDPDAEDDLKVIEAVKEELAGVFPMIRFHRMSVEFLLEFVVDRDIHFSLTKLHGYFLNIKKYTKEEAFKTVYLLAEKRALKKQELLPVPNFINLDAIKNELTGVLSKVKLDEMNIEFWMDFAIPKGLFLSPANLRIYFGKLQSKYRNQQDLFKVIYDLAEKQLLQKQLTRKDKEFNIYESIKNILIQILPCFKFDQMSLDFLMEFVVSKGLLLSPSIVKNFYLKCRKDYGNEEEAFKAVYKLAEKQALENHNGPDDNGFNLVNAIKDELSETIPVVDFGKMSKKFLDEFVVPMKFISQEQSEKYFYTCVEIKSDNTTMTGFFKDDYGIMKIIPAEGFYCIPRQWNKLRFIQAKFKIPTVPSTIQKMKRAEWYLCLQKDGYLTIKFHDLVERSDYLIAEMETTSDFMFNTDEHAYIRTFLNNNV